MKAALIFFTRPSSLYHSVASCRFHMAAVECSESPAQRSGMHVSKIMELGEGR